MTNRIRALFRPYQPSIDHAGEIEVRYEEAEPHHDLRNYVYCYWRLRSLEKLQSDFMYRVVSDGCIDILFEQKKPQDIFVTGFSTKYLEYNLSQSFDYLGIRFLPTGFPAMFDIPAHDLTNNFTPLKEAAPDLSSVVSSAINGKMNLADSSRFFDTLLRDYLDDRKKSIEIDQRLLNAMHQIMEARGLINLNQLDVGVSERQLRRLFEHYFGESPKTFAKITRFQNILGAKPSSESLKHNKIFYDEGYYDQAHFIKEFKAFYGVTPGKAFGR